MKLSEMMEKGNRERQALIEMIIESDDSAEYSIKKEERRGYSLPYRQPVVYAYGPSGQIVSGTNQPRRPVRAREDWGQ